MTYIYWLVTKLDWLVHQDGDSKGMYHQTDYENLLKTIVNITIN